MAGRSDKPSFSKFIKNIPKETLGQQLGYVDPERSTSLILHPESEQIIACIQENAACSPDTLGKNLKLHPDEVSEVIEAHPDRGIRIRCIICCWITANESEATVQALLEEGLWQSDDTNALTCVQNLSFEVAQGKGQSNHRYWIRKSFNCSCHRCTSGARLPPGKCHRVMRGVHMWFISHNIFNVAAKGKTRSIANGVDLSASSSGYSISRAIGKKDCC